MLLEIMRIRKKVFVYRKLERDAELNVSPVLPNTAKRLSVSMACKRDVNLATKAFGLAGQVTGRAAKRLLLSGPIKCESPKSLIHRLAPRICESQNQRILSRFSIKANIRESISAPHNDLELCR
jgi:hypothetical protein